MNGYLCSKKHIHTKFKVRFAATAVAPATSEKPKRMKKFKIYRWVNLM